MMAYGLPAFDHPSQIVSGKGDANVESAWKYIEIAALGVASIDANPDYSRDCSSTVPDCEPNALASGLLLNNVTKRRPAASAVGSQTDGNGQSGTVEIRVSSVHL